MGHLAGFLAAASLSFFAAGCASSLGGTLGVGGRTVDGDGDGGRGGVQVAYLHENSPLQVHGVRPGDVIVSLEGEPVGTVRDLGDRVRAAGFEKAVRIGIRTGEFLREVDVVPAEARRTVRIGLMIPFLGGWDDRTDSVTIGSVDAVDIGVGPDQKGLLLLNCVGYWAGPDSWDLRLAVLTTGSSYRIDPPAPPEAAASTSSP